MLLLGGLPRVNADQLVMEPMVVKPDSAQVQSLVIWDKSISTSRQVACKVANLVVRSFRSHHQETFICIQQSVAAAIIACSSRSQLHARDGEEIVPGTIFKPTLHGLRSTSVVLRRIAGYSDQQVSDDIGMSLSMVKRYSRFMDQKAAAENDIVILEQSSRRS